MASHTPRLLPCTIAVSLVSIQEILQNGLRKVELKSSSTLMVHAKPFSSGSHEYALQHHLVHTINVTWRFQKNGNNGEKKTFVWIFSNHNLCVVSVLFCITQYWKDLHLLDNHPLAVYTTDAPGSVNLVYSRIKYQYCSPTSRVQSVPYHQCQRWWPWSLHLPFHSCWCLCCFTCCEYLQPQHQACITMEIRFLPYLPAQFALPGTMICI